MTPLKTRILLADDHALVRRGLRLMLDAEPDLEVVAEAGDGAEAIRLALKDEVDLAIIDISMPRMTGLQAIAELTRRRPRLRTLILSMHENERYLYEALKAGASGYVLKSVADRDLIEACRAAMRGEAFLYPGAMTSLISDYLRQARDEDSVREDPLTAREQEVVKLIAESYSTKEIAEALVISEKTVDRHRTNSSNRKPPKPPKPTKDARRSGEDAVSAPPDQHHTRDARQPADHARGDTVDELTAITQPALGAFAGERPGGSDDHQGQHVDQVEGEQQHQLGRDGRT
jgi:DNA-binding NarL/FixJ family response regulator